LTAEATGKTKTARPKREILKELDELLDRKNLEFDSPGLEFIKISKLMAKIMTREGSTITQERLDTLFNEFLKK